MPLPVLYVVHQRRPATGRVARILSALGYPGEVRRPVHGDDLPPTMDGHAAAVVFGGPMSANDDSAYIREEIRWLERVADSGKPILGICLGGQLLARAIGGEVHAHPLGHCEVGWHRVDPADGAPAVFPEPMHFYQWHAEGMSLPPDAEVLATSDRFPVQAWRRKNAVGLQFHPEVTEAGMRFWVSRNLDRFLPMPGAQPAAEQFRSHVRHTPAVVRWARTFLATWVAGKLP